MKPKDLIRLLKENGWHEERFNGSHLMMKNDAGNMVVIPMHNKDLKPGTLNAILKSAGLK